MIKLMEVDLKATVIEVMITGLRGAQLGRCMKAAPDSGRPTQDFLTGMMMNNTGQKLEGRSTHYLTGVSPIELRMRFLDLVIEKRLIDRSKGLVSFQDATDSRSSITL